MPIRIVAQRQPPGGGGGLLPILTQAPFQVIGGLAICVLAPALARAQIPALEASAPTLRNAAVGAALAFMAGYYWLRRIAGIPGIRSGSHILVAVSAPYALVVAGFFLLRLDYSRFVFAISYMTTVAWFLASHIAARRAFTPELAIVPGGNGQTLTLLPGVRWRVLMEPPHDPASLPAVVADLRHDLSREWERFIANCTLAGVPVFHTKQVHESLTGKVQIEHLSENNFGSLLPNMAYLKVKHGLDWCLAVLALPFFLLIVGIVGPVIVIESGWPVFYRQGRIGYRGRKFTVYKFRTMKRTGRRAGAAAGGREAAITREGDRRITRIGAILRRYRIDELPQVINVLKGEMSWIGPRPEAKLLARWYEAELPFYRYRHVVRPGISGWAQVNQGHVAAPAQVLDKLHYDFFYIKYLSPWFDLVIALKTVRTVLSGFGAK